MSGRKTREEVLKERALDEARKAGTAPPQVDAEGNEINPHIPQFIAKAPWYLADPHQTPGLKHQRYDATDKEVVRVNEWYLRGARLAQATKYRKGACENCGAMSHKARDCTERPRAIGAKYTGKDIAPDEVVQEFKFDWDSKRDRWAGFDGADYMKRVAEHEKVEAERTRRRQEQLLAAQKAGEGQSLAAAASVDDERLDGTEGGVTAVKDQKTRTTVRNLRIREDTAKYLRNLDENSAFYDPKTRSMRENPNPDSKDSTFLGDNAMRYSGQAKEVLEMQLFAWEKVEKGTTTAEQQFAFEAMPTQALLAAKEARERKEKLAEEHRRRMLEKYGGEEHLEAPPPELRLAQSEVYVEYAPDGRVVKGPQPAMPKSKYPEDVYDRGHTAIYGSYWRDGAWGYACCKQTVRNAFCTGAAGREAAETADREMEARTRAREEQSALGKRAADGSATGDGTASRPWEQDVSAEQHEEYLKKKLRSDDPMAQFL